MMIKVHERQFILVPTQSPKNVAVKPLNSTAVIVSFSPPDPQMVPGFKKGYKVCFF